MVQGYAETVFGYDRGMSYGGRLLPAEGCQTAMRHAGANASMTTMQTSRRPGSLASRNIRITDLVHYRLPVAGMLSILHRVSGAAMFLLLPFALRWFGDSLASEAGFARVARCAGSWWGKLILLGAFWALMHHACAGVRFLLLDLHRGVGRASARKSAVAVFAVSLTITGLFGLWLFGLAGRAG